METNGLWKQALLTSRKQFETASVNSPSLECNVYFATGDGRKRFDGWQYKQLADINREDAAGQSQSVTSDLVVSALLFGKSEEGNLFNSLAEEAGGIIRDTPTEILKRLNIDYPQDMYWSTRWAATIAEIAVTLRFSKSRRKTWHDSLPMSIDWNPSRGGFYFIEVKNVFSASVCAIDVLLEQVGDRTGSGALNATDTTDTKGKKGGKHEMNQHAWDCSDEFKKELKDDNHLTLIDHVKSYAITHELKWTTLYKRLTSNRAKWDKSRTLSK